MAQVNLPPGFVLDEPSRLPPGFVIDKPEPEGYLANAWEAIKALPQAMIEGPVHEISAPSVRNFKQGIQAFRERDPVLGGLSVAASFPGAAYVADLSGKASQAIHDLRGGRLGSAANEAVQALPMGQTLKATQDRFYDRAVQEFARDPKSLIAADALGELHGNLAGFAAFEAAPKVAKATAKATRGRLPEIAAGATGFAIAGVPGVAAGVGAVEVLRAVKGYLKKSENVSGATAERMVREMPPERLLTVFEKAVDLPPAEIAQLFRSGRINDMGLTKAQKNALRARAGNTDTVPTNFEPQAPGTVEARLAKPAPVARTPEQRLEIVRAKYPQYDWEMGSDGNPVLRGRGSYPEQPATLPELPQVEPEAPVRGASPEIAPETPVGPPARPDPVPEAPRESMGGLTRAKMGYGVPQPPGGANAPWRGENPELGRLMLADRTAGLNEASTPARFDYGPRGGGRGEGTPAPSPIAEAYGIDTAAMLKQGIGDGAHPETGLPMKEVRNRQTGDITTRVLTRTEEDGLSWSHSPEWVMENAPDVIARHQARLKASEGRTSVPEVQRRLDEALRRDEPPPPGGVPNTNIDPALPGRKQRGRTKAQLEEQARRLAEPPVETGAKEALDAKIAENKTKGGDLAAVLAGEKPPVKPAAMKGDVVKGPTMGPIFEGMMDTLADSLKQGRDKISNVKVKLSPDGSKEIFTFDLDGIPHSAPLEGQMAKSLYAKGYLPGDVALDTKIANRMVLDKLAKPVEPLSPSVLERAGKAIDEARKNPGETVIVTAKEADAASKRIRVRAKKLGKGPANGNLLIDPEHFSDMVVRSVYHFERGARTIEAMTKALVKEFGPDIKAYVADLWDAATRRVVAWHGSPHKFDEFKINEKTIGTGEGAQAYGHGGYIAEAEGTGRGYFDQFSKVRTTDPDLNVPRKVTFRGKEIDLSAPSNTINSIEDLAGTYVAIEGNSPSKAIRALRQMAEFGAPDSAKFIEAADFLQKLLDSGDKDIFTKPEGPYLYKTDLPARAVENMLDWDKPLSEQPASVKKALADLRLPDVATGKQIYDALKNRAMSSLDPWDRKGLETYQGAASAALKKAGIPGIKYLDAGSRGAGDGTRNYVIFDDKLVRVLERNGEKVNTVADIPKQKPKRAVSQGKKLSAQARAKSLSLEDAKNVIERGKPIEGWLLHGRRKGGFVKSGDAWPVQLSNDPHVANSYASRGGSVWAFKPNKGTKTVDFSGENTRDMNRFVAAMKKPFMDRVHPAIEEYRDQVAGSKGIDPNEVTFQMFSDDVREQFSPEKIVDSARAFDDHVSINLLEYYPGGWPDFVYTPDGGVIIPGAMENVTGVNLTELISNGAKMSNKEN